MLVLNYIIVQATFMIYHKGILCLLSLLYKAVIVIMLKQGGEA